MQSEKNAGKRGERQREQEEEAKTVRLKGREKYTAAHRERREEDGGVGQERLTIQGWDLPLPRWDGD